MKVVGLGGTEEMGRYGARAAAGFDFVEEIVIADLDGEAAGRFAKEVSWPLIFQSPIENRQPPTKTPPSWRRTP